ncbi:MAG: hypothetical protein MUP47_08150 [Phycisphaerae bacterium]|nr:hypothetical protein [Phycisphaerae bacterium]
MILDFAAARPIIDNEVTMIRHRISLLADELLGLSSLRSRSSRFGGVGLLR